MSGWAKFADFLSGSAIGQLFGMANDYLVDKRQEKKETRAHNQRMEQSRQTFQHNRVISGDESAANNDLVSLQTRGWKDDYLLIVTSLPLVVMFVEPLIMAFLVDEYIAGSAINAIQSSFEALNQAPEYYKWALAIIYVDTFGFRRMCRIALEHFLRSKFGKLLP